jgi:uncharacterized protein (UPF0335 family)
MSEDIIEAGSGHNSLSPDDLKRYCERIEALIEDRKAINADIKQVLEEADMNGFHKKTLNAVIKIRAMDPDERREQDELRDAYLSALGLL